MARIKNAVLDTGPLTHLGRISSLKVFRIFQGILLSEDVARELGDASRLPANCKLAKLEGQYLRSKISVDDIPYTAHMH